MLVSETGSESCSPAVHPNAAGGAVREPESRETSDSRIWVGVGACSKPGCPCPAYEQKYGTELCGNCGHKYTDHW